jgi:hypothetical protein
MIRATSRWPWIGALALGCCCLGGCGGNPNEAEYMKDAPPAKQAEPESVANRRERTKSVVTAPAKGSRTKR